MVDKISIIQVEEEEKKEPQAEAPIVEAIPASRVYAPRELIPEAQKSGPYEVLIYGWLKVSVNKGDLTDERVDAIVNAANSYLHHAGGLAAAIVRKGGQ